MDRDYLAAHVALSLSVAYSSMVVSCVEIPEVLLHVRVFYSELLLVFCVVGLWFCWDGFSLFVLSWRSFVFYLASWGCRLELALLLGYHSRSILCCEGSRVCFLWHTCNSR